VLNINITLLDIKVITKRFILLRTLLRLRWASAHRTSHLHSLKIVVKLTEKITTSKLLSVCLNLFELISNLLLFEIHFQL